MIDEDPQSDGGRVNFLLSEVDRLRDEIDKAMAAAPKAELQELVSKLVRTATELDDLRRDATLKMK